MLLLRESSANKKNYFVTLVIIPWCIPQQGRLFLGVSHNQEDYSTVYPTIQNNSFCVISMRVSKVNKNAL